MDTLTCIKTRRSIRRFKKDEVPLEAVHDIIDCARKAPSGCDTQPWAFVIVRDHIKLQALSQIHKFSSFVANAPVCIVLCLTNEKIRFTPSEYFSVACAAQNILLAAHDHNLGACWVYIKDFDNESIGKRVRKILSVPKDVEPICMIPIGYPDEKPTGRTLKPAGGLVHNEQWSD